MNVCSRRTVHNLSIFALGFFALVFAPLTAAHAQTGTPPPFNPNQILGQAGFLAYQCQFQAQTNTVTIQAALNGADGDQMPANSYSIAVQEAGNGNIVIPPDNVKITPATQRNPLQMIVVFDATNTMPLPEIVNAFSTSFAPALDPQDQLAMLVFGGNISPMTQFYTDKNRLVAENLLNIRPRDADNRLYDSIYQALDYFRTSTDTTRRRVILVITDSGRRGTQQVADSDIIARAQSTDTQIYFISFLYADHPDVDAMMNISQASNGYSWVFDGEKSRVAVGNAVGQYLTDVVHTLNSEVSINVDLSGQNLTLTNTGVVFQLTVTPANERTITGQITCPVQSLHHSIAFTNAQDSTVFTVPVNVTVDVHSDLSLSDTHTAFWLNDVVIQNNSSRSYTINAPDLQPGLYTLRAELRDRNDQVLATTPTLQTYVQQTLRLNTSAGSTNNLNGSVQFQAIANLGIKLPDIQFRVGTAANPSVTYPLGSGTASLQDDGRAVLSIDNIHDALKRLFPNEQGKDFVISAFVPGTTADTPLLAQSSPLAFNVTSAPANAEDASSITTTSSTGSNVSAAPAAAGLQNVTAQIAAWNTNPLLLPSLFVVFMLVLNILLFRQVKRSRIYRMIYVPDGIELSDRLMAITVRRAGTVKTHPLTKNTIYLGRGSQNDINIGDDAAISRSHGVVIWRKGSWYYTNRNPHSMTRVDGKRYRGYKLRKLEPVTEIEIGSTHLYFHSNAQQDISELTKTNL